MMNNFIDNAQEWFKKHKGYGIATALYLTPLYWYISATKEKDVEGGMTHYSVKVGPVAAALSLGEVEDILD